MTYSFSQFINEATASGVLEFNTIKRLLSKIDDEYDNSYINWMAWVRPMVNQLEISFDYGQVSDPVNDEEYAVMIDAKVKFAFNKLQATLLDSSDDDRLLIDLELMTPSELLEQMYLQVITTRINLKTNEEKEFYSAKNLIPLSEYEIKFINMGSNSIYQVADNIMQKIIRVGLKPVS
jgi:6-pyruvoyl-tetrahydropterin synthase